MAVLAQQMENMTKSMDSMVNKVDALETQPGKRWDSLVDKALWLVAGAFLAWLLSGMTGVGV